MKHALCILCHFVDNFSRFYVEIIDTSSLDLCRDLNFFRTTYMDDENQRVKEKYKGEDKADYDETIPLICVTNENTPLSAFSRLCNF